MKKIFLASACFIMASCNNSATIVPEDNLAFQNEQSLINKEKELQERERIISQKEQELQQKEETPVSIGNNQVNNSEEYHTTSGIENSPLYQYQQKQKAAKQAASGVKDFYARPEGIYDNSKSTPIYKTNTGSLIPDGYRFNKDVTDRLNTTFQYGLNPNTYLEQIEKDKQNK